jgi:hypothetical protein
MRFSDPFNLSVMQWAEAALSGARPAAASLSGGLIGPYDARAKQGVLMRAAKMTAMAAVAFQVPRGKLWSRVAYAP